MKLRPWILAGAGLAAILTLRIASCDQATADRWDQDVKVVLQLHRKVVAANRQRDRYADALHKLEQIRLKKADSLEVEESSTQRDLAAVATAADSMRLIQKGWAQCRLRATELRGAQALCAERADTGKVSQQAAETVADSGSEVLGDRPRRPRSVLAGLSLETTIIRECWSSLAGLHIEARKRVWLFELDGRATLGAGVAQCRGPRTTGPGLGLGVTLGF